MSTAVAAPLTGRGLGKSCCFLLPGTCAREMDQECHLTPGVSTGASACSVCQAGTYGTGSGRKHFNAGCDWMVALLTRICRAFRSRCCRLLQPVSAWDILDELRWTFAGGGRPIWFVASIMVQGGWIVDMPRKTAGCHGSKSSKEHPRPAS